VNSQEQAPRFRASLTSIRTSQQPVWRKIARIALSILQILMPMSAGVLDTKESRYWRTAPKSLRLFGLRVVTEVDYNQGNAEVFIASRCGLIVTAMEFAITACRSFS